MDIKKIISEIIMEGFSDNDIIHPKRINLQQEYDKYNNLFFDGELPRIELKWTKSRDVMGKVQCLVSRLTGEFKLVFLGLSVFFEMNYRTFKNVLVHEMIHVSLIHKKQHIRHDPHGTLFHNEAERINRSGHNFNITEINNEKLSVSNSVKMKKLIALIFNINNEYRITTMTSGVFIKEYQNIIDMFEYLVNKKRIGEKIEVSFIESSNPKLLMIQQNRSFSRSIRHNSLDDELFSELLDDKIIKTIIFERDKQNKITEDSENEWVPLTVI